MKYLEELMVKNLVIVESPAKAKTIEGFLGKDFLVKSSFGHVRDLAKKNLGVDVDNNFEPAYEISPEKAKVIKDLKKDAKKAEMIWLASDEDREGEAISWHLIQALGLDEEKTKRIVFHEITKSAILDAIKNPRSIDKNLVDAQQARRVLDRLVGFELSPLLWKKIRPALSAGRVQSVAVRLIVEKEEDIKSFEPVSYYKVTAHFYVKNANGQSIMIAEVLQRFNTRQKAEDFLTNCIGAEFTVENIETKPATKSPAPPFTTSTLQQEASRKLGFSVANTMRVAQQLYELGKITYMRTDSVNLSNLALSKAKTVITNSYGAEYSKTRKFATKSKGAQEAHEAIRPTYLETASISGDTAQKRLYDLIWKRAIASQMSNAILEKTIITIDISTVDEKLIAKGEVIKFEGFLKLYLESQDEETTEVPEGVLPKLTIGEKLNLKQMNASQRFTSPPYRYSEATLVRKLEELGIGRPSTYAPIISTIQRREYVEKGDKQGRVVELTTLILMGGKISEKMKNEKTGFVKGRLFPTDIGVLVNTFLMKNFKNIMNDNFTADVEKEFDEIAKGEQVWNQMINEFYSPFHKQVEKTLKSSDKAKGEKLLGQDPESGKNIYVKLGRYGAIVQLGNTDNTVKPRFAGLKKNQSIDSITLEDALDLFKLPRTLGNHEENEVIVASGRFGPYVRHKSNFYSLGKNDDPLTIQLSRAIELIAEKRKQDKDNIIKEFDENKDVRVLKGRYGPYISIGKSNYKIPKNKEPESLTLKECLELAEHIKTIKAKKKPRKK